MSKVHHRAPPIVGMLTWVALSLACSSVKLNPEQTALIAGGDCEKLITEADHARIQGDGNVAKALATACTQDNFALLVDKAAPAQALLWCGRAETAVGRENKPACDFKKVGLLKESLKPKLSLGPPDPANTPDPTLTEALDTVGPELNLIYAADPDVIIGKIQLTIEEQTTTGFTTVGDPSGHRRQVPSTNHRLVARCQAQVELLAKTRTLRASAESRSVSWEGDTRWKIPPHPAAVPISQDDLKKKAVLAWLRAVAKALWLSPPETVDTDDDRGCVAYGIALNAQSGNPDAAAKGLGDKEKIQKCEPIIGEPSGGGIPVP